MRWPRASSCLVSRVFTHYVCLSLGNTRQDSEINTICKAAQLDADEVRRYLWIRKRTAFVSKKVSKFTEAFWRFLMYAVFCVIGYRTLFVPTVAPWILDTNQHWDKWPSHRITSTVEFYYHVQLGETETTFAPRLWTSAV